MKTPYCIADDNHVKEKFAYLCQQEHGMQVLERCVESQLYFLPIDRFLVLSSFNPLHIF